MISSQFSVTTPSPTLPSIFSMKFSSKKLTIANVLFYAPIHSRHLEHLERQRLHLHQILQHKLSVDLLFFPTCPLKFLGRLCSQTGPDERINDTKSVISNQSQIAGFLPVAIVTKDTRFHLILHNCVLAT